MGQLLPAAFLTVQPDQPDHPGRRRERSRMVAMQVQLGPKAAPGQGPDGGKWEEAKWKSGWPGRKKLKDCPAHTSLLETRLHHNVLDRAVALNGRIRGEPTECRPPAGRGEADCVFTSLMLGAPPQSELMNSDTHTHLMWSGRTYYHQHLCFFTVTKTPTEKCREWIPTHVNLYLTLLIYYPFVS